MSGIVARNPKFTPGFHYPNFKGSGRDRRRWGDENVSYSSPQSEIYTGVSVIRTLWTPSGTEDAGGRNTSGIIARNPKFTPGCSLSELCGLQ